ncbi:MAG: response regulator [Candidatus Taylorbacteria bacterium CG10_big_fil_rev_8_21_14_0_10_41_48]|uniref:Response regulator n=1 Tax=Candidatus Taylorbacteria bacterium CG10_big_fil_rev_8_21_14_0_10_41_48 TaxID=1975024 RepID=A0A2M8LC56_9BACT|nr:MAG: response regulator [Candidatus Taylorbacteria bacterium CG10_big_fil_rev_8_21_14_0_10_41_48]
MDSNTQKKIKVFIVDDDKFLLGMYSLKFSNNGYEVDTTVGSVLALEKLRAGAQPDVLLLDIIMPHMDGLELLKTIRDEKLVPNATVVMLTNQSQSSDIERAKELNVDGYIVKASTIPSEVMQEVQKIYTEKQAKGLK